MNKYPKRLAMTAARKAKGLTQRELAEKVGVTRATISQIENGSGNPTRKLMDKICLALGYDKYDPVFPLYVDPDGPFFDKKWYESHPEEMREMIAGWEKHFGSKNMR